MMVRTGKLLLTHVTSLLKIESIVTTRRCRRESQHSRWQTWKPFTEVCRTITTSVSVLGMPLRL